jgi:hypothetical protein
LELTRLFEGMARTTATARARALESLVADTKALSRRAADIPLSGHVRVSGRQWVDIVEDSDFASLVRSFDEAAAALANVRVSSPPEIGALLRPGCRHVLNATRAFVETVEQVSWFAPDDANQARQRRAMGLLAQKAGHATHAIVSALAAGAGDPPELDLPLEGSNTAAKALEVATNGADADPVRLNFGVEQAALVDQRGIVHSGRLLAAFDGRQDELDRCCERVLRSVMKTPGDRGLVRQALSLCSVDRLLRAHRAALLCHRLIDTTFATEPERIVALLRAHKMDADRGAASHRGMVGVSEQARAARTQGERVLLELDGYRRLAEGWLRPWAWLVLRLRGARDGRAPELHSLREMLLAQRDSLCTLIADGIDPGLRNAAAHEDAYFDDRHAQVVARPESIDRSRITLSTAIAYAACVGCESALAMARTDSEALRGMTDADTTAPPAIREMYAREAFGRIGFLVSDSWKADEEHVVVIDGIDGFEPRLPMLLFALVESYQQDTFCRQWTVRTARSQDTVLTVDGDALKRCSELASALAEDFGPRLPRAVLLPVLASAKLHVLGPEAAAEQVAELALAEALRPFLEGAADDRATTTAAARACIVAAESLRAALDVLGAAAGARHLDLAKHIRSLGKTAEAVGRGETEAVAILHRDGAALLARYHSFDHAPLLPGMSTPTSDWASEQQE